MDLRLGANINAACRLVYDQNLEGVRGGPGSSARRPDDRPTALWISRAQYGLIEVRVDAALCLAQALAAQHQAQVAKRTANKERIAYSLRRDIEVDVVIVTG